jgi:hypothetical protein
MSDFESSAAVPDLSDKLTFLKAHPTFVGSNSYVYKSQLDGNIVINLFVLFIL